MTYLKNLLLSIGVVLAPIKMSLLAVFILCVVDLVSGILAARKRGEVITSYGIRRTVLKLFIYESSIICAFLVEMYLTGPDLLILKLVTSLIGLAELKSVLENLNTLSEGSLLKAILDKLSVVDVKPPENK